ncbi:sensor of ECF-type sigma factor [Urechidicola croceus]|nr:sensor of ECF-type sigma factor [Urechidicola croceus]
MKHKIFFILMLVFSINTSTYAQKHDANRFKTLKVGYITETLDLTSKEAEKFWPIYNEHQEKIHQLRIIESTQLKLKIRRNGGIDSLSESEAKQILARFIEIDAEIQKEQSELYENLKNVIPPKKILKLLRAEHDFNRRILEQLRKRRDNFRD